MLNKLILSILFWLFFSVLIQAQESTNLKLIRSTVATAGSSKKISVNNKTFIIQQSINQASMIGSFVGSNCILRQGFIQPTILAINNKKGDTNKLLDLEVIVYPNPFTDQITMQFNEAITSDIKIEIFDLLGRLTFSKEYGANRNITINPTNLSSTQYVLKISANQKQNIYHLIKK